MRGLFLGIYLQGIIITEIDNPMYNRFSFIFHLKKLKRKKGSLYMAPVALFTFQNK